MAEDMPEMESEDLDEDYPTVTDGVRRPSYDQGKGPRKGSLNRPGPLRKVSLDQCPQEYLGRRDPVHESLPQVSLNMTLLGFFQSGPVFPFIIA